MGSISRSEVKGRQCTGPPLGGGHAGVCVVTLSKYLNCGCGGEYKHPTHTTFTYCILGTISVRTSDKLELFLVLFIKYMTTDHYALMCDNGLLSTEHFISHNSLSSRASVDGLVLW